MSSESFFVEPTEESKRIDKLLADRYAPYFSRTYFVDLIAEGLVVVNGELIKKRQKLQGGDCVEICFSARPGTDLQPEALPLDIIYEDSDLLVINKPPGLVVHPAPGNWTGTFVNALLYHCRELKNWNDTLRPGIVHRLDKDTTGLLVAAKNLEAQKRLIEAFSSRKVYKEYLTISFGRPKEGRLETLIGRDPKNRQKMAVLNEGGKTAITIIKNLKTARELSLNSVVIETGRTHQIRVHLKYLNAPVLGDGIYGSMSANKRYQVERPLLHAWKLKLPHPIKGEVLELEAPPPRSFTQEFFILSDIPSIG